MKMSTHVNLRLPAGLYAALEQRAREQGTTVSEAMRRAMHKGTRDEQGERPGREIN